MFATLIELMSDNLLQLQCYIVFLGFKSALFETIIFSYYNLKCSIECNLNNTKIFYSVI